MSTPVSAPIKLTEVNTELGETLPIQLAQPTVRTLCSIPSGSITLLDCLNRTFFTYQRANTSTTTGTSHGTVTNPTYAYDTTGTSVDSSTYAALSTLGNNQTIVTYEFATGTVTGTVSVNLLLAEVNYQLSSDTTNQAASDILVQWSTDNGSTWSNIWIEGVANFSGYDTNGYVDHAGVLTKTLSSQAMADFQVRITTNSVTIGAIGPSRAAAAVSWHLADVVVLP